MGVRMKLGLSYLAMVLMIVFLGIYALVSMANMQAATRIGIYAVVMDIGGR